MTDEELREKFLGKRVEVEFRESTIVGICNNIGHNGHLSSWGLVVVVNRLPVTNLNESQIKLVQELEKAFENGTGTTRASGANESLPEASNETT